MYFKMFLKLLCVTRGIDLQTPDRNIWTHLDINWKGKIQNGTFAKEYTHCKFVGGIVFGWK